MADGRRKVYLDALRILAMLLVIFNHLPGYMLFQISGGVKGWIYTFITMFTRINVPIFFMISGALLLGKQESLSVIFKKRVARIVLVLALFSALTYSVSEYPVIQFDWKVYVQKLLAGSISTPYWFLYTYIGFLISLPYLRKIAAGFSKKDFLYLLIIRFVLVGLIPLVNYITSLYFSFPIRMSSDLKLLIMTERLFFYPLMGYYLGQVLDITKIKGKHLAVLLAAFLLSIVIPSAVTIHQGRNGTFTQNYVQMFDYIIAICVFVAARIVFKNERTPSQMNIIEKCICAIGPLTMGMYLLDPVWRKLFYAKAFQLLEPHMPTLIFSLCWCVFSATLGGLFTYVLRKIPGLKKIL